MNSPYDSIIQLLNTQNIHYEIITHWKNNLVLHQGAKSMVLKTNNNFLLIILAGDRRLDLKKIKDVFKIQQLQLATNDEIKMLMGCEIGTCHPIGKLINLKTYVDTSLAENEKIFFNPGLLDKWILMTWKDFMALTNPTIISVAQ